MDADPTAGDGVYRLLWLHPWDGRAEINVKRALLRERGVPDDRRLAFVEALQLLIPLEDVETLRLWVRRVLDEDARVKADPFPRDIEFLRVDHDVSAREE